MPTILITGASSGIGKATALRFQSEGWNVIATMCDPSVSDLGELDNILLTRLGSADGRLAMPSLVPAMRHYKSSC